MPYLKDPVPVGASLEELVRYYDGELTKLEQETQEHVAMLEAFNIIGVTSTWFWDDTGGLGEPPPGRMRANTNAIQDFTVINVNLIDAAGRDIGQLLKTSSINETDLVGLINTSGIGAGNYVMQADAVLQGAPTTFITLSVGSYTGSNGNPAVDDVMQLRWEFATAPGVFEV